MTLDGAADGPVGDPVRAAVQTRAEALGVTDLTAVDSLVVVELALDLEEDLGVVLTREDLAGVVTLDQLADVVSARIGA